MKSLGRSRKRNAGNVSGRDVWLLTYHIVCYKIPRFIYGIPTQNRTFSREKNSRAVQPSRRARAIAPSNKEIAILLKLDGNEEKNERLSGYTERDISANLA